MAYISSRPIKPIIALAKQPCRHTHNGVGLGRVAGHRFATAVNQELGEIPLDEVAERSALLVLQEGPERVGVIPVHLDLGEHVELHLVSLSKLLDLLLRAWLLGGEGCKD